jgi:hypothetical protein
VVAADRRPCYEDLAVENGELRALVERLTARLDALESENAELRRFMVCGGGRASMSKIETDVTIVEFYCGMASRRAL